MIAELEAFARGVTLQRSPADTRRICKKGTVDGGTDYLPIDWCLDLKGERTMARKNPAADPSMDGGKQVRARPHDSGSAANETIDGLDATTEALRHAAEDTPSGAAPDDIEKTPVFDRADLAPKI
jgi:hypothetical protein